MTFAEEKAAVDARLDLALAAALVVDSGFTMLKGGRNLQKSMPSGDGLYLRGYRRRIGHRRLGMDEGFDRYDGMVFIQIMVPETEGDDLVEPAWEAIEPIFRTNGDGLQFEDAPDLADGVEDGSHFVAVASFPYYFDRLRP